MGGPVAQGAKGGARKQRKDHPEPNLKVTAQLNRKCGEGSEVRAQTGDEPTRHRYEWKYDAR